MLKVLTYNIHKGFNRFNRDFVLHRMKEVLQTIDIDVLLLQEIQGRHLHHELHHPEWPQAAQFEFLADDIWPHHAYGKNALYARGHHGNAILSRHVISEWQNINLSRFRRASRSLLHGKIMMPGSGRPVHLLCVHLDLIGFERKRQINELGRYFDDHIPRDDAVILGGDFNDWQGRAKVALESRLQLRESYQSIHGSYAKTFPSGFPMLRMDRIYFRGMELSDAFCLRNAPWNELSDHLPLYAKFGMK